MRWSAPIATTCADVKDFHAIRGTGRNPGARRPQTDAEGKKTPQRAR
jgi:hypothetical protein